VVLVRFLLQAANHTVPLSKSRSLSLCGLCSKLTISQSYPIDCFHKISQSPWKIIFSCSNNNNFRPTNQALRAFGNFGLQLCHLSYMHWITYWFILLFTVSFGAHCLPGQLIGFHHYDGQLTRFHHDPACLIKLFSECSD
jgi:hypothetical protein